MFAIAKGRNIMLDADIIPNLRADYIAAMARAATPVTIVTTNGAAGRFGLTVSAVTSVTADPPMLLACVNRRNQAAAAITENGVFAVNHLAADNRVLAESFAGRPAAGEAYDFAHRGWREGHHGLPLLDLALASFECEIESWHDAGTHRVFIGRVLASRAGGTEPLIYVNRAFARVAPY
jgi:flavin reductase (DIM6/NTAB) family NADH-FMN oxidoreductase RutF